MAHDEDYIDYATMIDEAMRGVVRQTLKKVEKHGLPGAHHFFISFDTGFPGVEISDALHAKYPDEMTIVMQHQFSSLKVEEEKFSVTLSFNNIPTRLVVPFNALTAFADPSIKFGLQFHLSDDDEDDDIIEALPFEDEEPTPAKKPAAKRGRKKAEDAGGDDDKPKGGAEVISLDSFRKK